MDSIICYDYSGNPLKNLYQWDSNQRILMSGIDVASSVEVHFCHTDSSEALVQTPNIDGTNIVSTIPNILLQQAKPLIVYVFQDSAELGTRTVGAVRVPVYPRPKPADYLYTETEVLCYREIDARIRALEAGEALGGYYTPKVTQITDTLAEVSFTPSTADMPAVAPQTIALPVGPQGETGANGEDGKPGVTFTPSVSEDGTLSWTNDGGLENPAPVTIKGSSGSGVYIGAEEPTDSNVNVWIDTDEEVSTEDSDFIPVPTTAEVGQTIVVKAVDENGKPTEWETADLPSGGGGAEWKKIASVSVVPNDGVAKYILDKDENDNSFSFEEVMIAVKLPDYGGNLDVWFNSQDSIFGDKATLTNFFTFGTRRAAQLTRLYDRIYGVNLYGFSRSNEVAYLYPYFSATKTTIQSVILSRPSAASKGTITVYGR